MAKAARLEPAAPSPRQARQKAWISAHLITLIVAVASVGYYRNLAGPGYPLDDAWIHLAFADNLAHGHGFGINGGEPTPGATSPLWVILLAIGDIFGAGLDTWPRVLGIAFLAGCGALGVALCRRLGRGDVHSLATPLIAGACGVAIVTCFPLVWCAAGAMEPPLFGAMFLATLFALYRSRNDSWKSGAIWGLFAGLAANSRPEGILIIPLAAAADLFLGRGEWMNRFKRAAVGALVAALLTLPYVIFCLSTTGRPFPNTYYAKTVSTQTVWPDPSYLINLIGLTCKLAAEPVVGAIMIFIALVAFWRKTRDAAAPVVGLAFAAALPLSYATMDRSFLFAGGAGNLGRYLFPMFPPLLVLSFAALIRISQEISARRHRRWPTALAILLALAATASGINRTIRMSDVYREGVHEIDNMHVQMALMLNEHLPAGSLVAANDVGALACLTDLRVLDLVGIISTDVLNVLRPRAAEPPADPDAALFELLARKKPDAIVIFPDWYPALYARLRPGLNYITEVHLSQHFTAGGDRLVAYTIDWTRISTATPTAENPSQLSSPN